MENRAGGGGGIGMTAIARSAPVGYTIGYGNVNTLAINRTLFKKLAYDVDRDIAPTPEKTTLFIGKIESTFSIFATFWLHGLEAS